MLEKNWNDLITPSNVVITAKDGDIKGTVIAEPIERGYGLTIGNSLRRVLLSSLQGAAITAIKIENVLHEFSTIAGVREDVVDLILNIKNISVICNLAKGNKCNRSWKILPEVGTDKDYPDLSLRDASVMKEINGDKN